MIIGPNGDPVSSKPGPTIDQQAESIADIVIRKIRELVCECLKDLNGGIMPSQKKMKRFLVRNHGRDGDYFTWKGAPMLFVGNHSTHPQPNGRIGLNLPFKKLYKPTIEKPLVASN